jgi:hypothetical protein
MDQRWITDGSEEELMATKKKVSAAAKKDEKNRRRSIDVGPHIGQVSPVNYWYQHGHFANEDEARGAFKLAYEQYMDGLGESLEQWLGADWFDGPLPPLKNKAIAERMGMAKKKR